MRQFGSEWLQGQAPAVTEKLTAALVAKGRAARSVTSLHAMLEGSDTSARESVHKRLQEGTWAYRLIRGEGKIIANRFCALSCGHVGHNRSGMCAHHAECPCRVQGESGDLDPSGTSPLTCGDCDRTGVDFASMMVDSTAGVPVYNDKHYICKMVKDAGRRQLPAEHACNGKPLESESGPDFTTRQTAIASTAIALACRAPKRPADADGSTAPRLPAKRARTVFEEGFCAWEISAARGGWAVAALGFKVPQLSESEDRLPTFNLSLAAEKVCVMSSNVPPFTLCACDQAIICGPRCRNLLSRFASQLVLGTLPQAVIDLLCSESETAAPTAGRGRKGQEQGAPLEQVRDTVAALASRVAQLESQMPAARTAAASQPVVGIPISPANQTAAPSQ